MSLPASAPITPDVQSLFCLLPDDLRAHSERVARLSVPVGAALNLGADAQHALFLAALLHDLGKRHLPAALLDKPGPLTPAEWTLMRRHPDWSVRDVQGLPALPPAVLFAIATHHERWDSGGYPVGLQGETIPLLGRILSVCDVFDALCSARAYKPAWSREAAWAELRRGREQAFCPRTLDAFLAVHAAQGNPAPEPKS